MSKHTPGPWIASPDPHGVLSDWMVGTINGKPDDIAVCEEENARLIAAAPDLLEALRALLAVAPYHAPGAAHGVMGAEERHAIAIKAARAAISKAEGKE